MKSLILNAILTLLARLDQFGLLEIARAILFRQVDAWLLARIEHLIRLAERNDWPGADKFRWVLQQLTAPGSPVCAIAQQVPGWLLNYAIEASVARLKQLEGHSPEPEAR